MTFIMIYVKHKYMKLSKRGKWCCEDANISKLLYDKDKEKFDFDEFKVGIGRRVCRIIRHEQRKRVPGLYLQRAFMPSRLAKVDSWEG